MFFPLRAVAARVVPSKGCTPQGHTLQGCTSRGIIPPRAKAGGTHPKGMHSCLELCCSRTKEIFLV